MLHETKKSELFLKFQSKRAQSRHPTRKVACLEYDFIGL